jgi:hypothetical protein
MASPRIRAALGRVEKCADSFNEAVAAGHATFKERGDAISQQSGFSLQVGNWHYASFESVLRHGIRGSNVLTNPFTHGPGASASATLTAEQEGFAQGWEADEAVHEATTRVGEAETALDDAASSAIADLDAAMKRIADKYEHEPD